MFVSRALAFRRTALQLAESVSKGPINLNETSAALLPPLALYRRLLRVHRKLSIEMRSLGDDYVKAEFRRHRNVDNPLQIVAFLSQWKLYLDGLELDQGGHNGRRLDPDTFEKLSEEQLYQLHELMQATREIYDPEKAMPGPPPAVGVGPDDGSNGSGGRSGSSSS